MTNSINSPLFFKDAEMSWEEVEKGIQRQIVGLDERIMMVRVKFRKEAIGALHNHIHSQVTYISEGEFNVTIGNKTQHLKKGDSFFIPSNKMHGVVCLKEGMLIDVFSPLREDFIK